ncbi:MAG: glycosyltransferase family 2 protein [Bacteroidetes bacterium]|nr:MAG: glycosyltransferase family 2 protein [Bacteroidota bacterium]
MLSVAVITKNEEANIARCLESVRWADELVVVDSGSTDRTAELARSFGARVIVREWEGFSKQKEFALRSASHGWVLSLDADEEVTPELREELLGIIARPDALNGYEIPRKSFFLGTWMRHGGWYPGYQLRLLRKDRTAMNHRPVHEGFETEGPVGRCRGDINHYTYATLHQYIEKMNDYSSLDVSNKLRSGKRIAWYNVLLNPLSAFLRQYVSKQGFRDGYHGFLLAWYSALHVQIIYAKSWEYRHAERSGAPLPPVSSGDLLRLKRLS